MTDYTLYYWPIQFRGQFVRSVLAHIGCVWEEAGYEASLAQRTSPPGEQLIAHMGPPVLTDHQRNIHVSQMPAILSFLGEKHDLTGTDPATRAMCLKVVCDANDVLYEMTRYNGAQMWTDAAWADFLPRLHRWMGIFEETGWRYGVRVSSGFMLGGDAPGLADLVTSTLWGTMTAKLPALRPVLDRHAPAIAGLTDRIAAIDSQIELRSRSDAAFGDAWCGGQIEASLREVLRRKQTG
ncbi:glutathione S-transferase [Hoeflea alexandrii]|uniref:Glutathione S-transferase n=1 Tax=Hoeflea alexandrii TaxID=288436 RepID=A0ABT1CT43_9HYPH|nr:glutathione S-transferase [Hoeflea alexandrii]MCO6408561.1 glutathione S-transferase [Hoeflea alexandrii]MCY0151256.1 glutathione S-transferase [Hoeflea alexandrii]